MLKAYPICKTKYAETAFNGEGAFRFGGMEKTVGKCRHWQTVIKE